MNNLFSKQYTSYSITKKSNNTLEYNNKDFPYIANLNYPIIRNPYSIEEILDILGIDFSYNYDPTNSVLTLEIPLESSQK